MEVGRPEGKLLLELTKNPKKTPEEEVERIICRT
jgi:hypothetical protein